MVNIQFVVSLLLTQHWAGPGMVCFQQPSSVSCFVYRQSDMTKPVIAIGIHHDCHVLVVYKSRQPNPFLAYREDLPINRKAMAESTAKLCHPKSKSGHRFGSFLVFRQGSALNELAKASLMPI